MSAAEETVEQLEKELKEIEQEMQKPSFWQDKEKSQAKQKQYSLLKAKIAEKKQYDKGPAILSIQSGAGGRDAQDWTVLLLRMYQRFCQRQGWSYRLLSEQFGEGGGPEGRIGIKEATMEIKGDFAFALLKKETGVHRLVRQSPFSAKKIRHTSFSKVQVLPKIEAIDKTSLKISPEDLRIETFRASGPGGQYVNKRESAVRITHLPTGLKASSQVERLQGQNRKIALQVLLAKLLALKEEKRAQELKDIKTDDITADFGYQIRSYVLHPYKLVKDHRANIETSNVDEVLDGGLEPFIKPRHDL